MMIHKIYEAELEAEGQPTAVIKAFYDPDADVLQYYAEKCGHTFEAVLVIKEPRSYNPLMVIPQPLGLRLVQDILQQSWPMCLAAVKKFDLGQVGGRR